MEQPPVRKHQTVYFSDQDLADRFNEWCRHRGLAPGRAIQVILKAFIDEMELQKDMMEVTLTGKDVKFV